MTKIKLFAGTDIGLRDNNEDNFIVCPDLTKDSWMLPDDFQEAIPLGAFGCLLVVADGMGGMNAGEVASDIAIKTVRQMFAPAVIPKDAVKKSEMARSYLKKVIIQANDQIMRTMQAQPATVGMGSTIVIAWLIGGMVHVAWLGDSRAYSYIAGKGLVRLSKDHSYVQQLVDAKVLSQEDAISHPQSNVVTRSLGDSSQKPKPEVVSHVVEQGEIILLCSDGLCGTCTDKEIVEVLKSEHANLQQCKEALTERALDLGGNDNITVALLQVTSLSNADCGVALRNRTAFLNLQNVFAILFAIMLLTGLVFAGYRVFQSSNPSSEHVTEKPDSSKNVRSSDTIRKGDTKKQKRRKVAPQTTRKTNKNAPGVSSINSKNKLPKLVKEAEINDASATTPSATSGESQGAPTPANNGKLLDVIKSNSNK